MKKICSIQESSKTPQIRLISIFKHKIIIIDKTFELTLSSDKSLSRFGTLQI